MIKSFAIRIPVLKIARAAGPRRLFAPREDTAFAAHVKYRPDDSQGCRL
jgi:hypothetical protein